MRSKDDTYIHGARKERAGVIWEEFEATAPELAAVGRAQLEQSGVALIGTIRKDGSSLIEYGHGEQSVKVWPLGKEFKRPYG